MPNDLNAYFREVVGLIPVIRETFDPQTTLSIRRTPGTPMLGTRLQGELRRDGIVLSVKEFFNFDPASESITKDYRYSFLLKGADLLRIETQAGFSEHAHFPPRYISNSNRHYNIDKWPPHFQDMDFRIAFRLWGEIVRNGGLLPEPFRSAR